MRHPRRRATNILVLQRYRKNLRFSITMSTPSSSREGDTKRKSMSPGLGVSKTIKKSRSGGDGARRRADAVKADIEKNETPTKHEPNVGLEPKKENKDESAEYNVKHPIDDPMRTKVRNLLCKALRTDNPKAEGAVEVAAAIEHAMFKNLEPGAPYKNKARTLSFNLKDVKNKNLRESVLERELLPSRLVQMTSEELANDDLKRDREKVVEKFTRDAQPFNNVAASTDQFKCGKCKQRKVSAYISSWRENPFGV